ncbi:uncharacterized protein LOC141684402 isoform X3 [Apium graveolens]|uniref:uncharacterized protein LOC141684402 isoform X3 n=1 Tax=Apium graveolens TaxID=4045 RepID=UPI003D7A1D97
MLDLSGQLLIPNILCTLSLMFAGSCHDSPACHADDECRLSSVISLAQVEEGPSRMSGRPRRGVTKLIEHNYGLGSCEIQQSCDQCHDALACHEAHGCRLNSVITSAQGLSPESVYAPFHAPPTESPIEDVIRFLSLQSCWKDEDYQGRGSIPPGQKGALKGREEDLSMSYRITINSVVFIMHHDPLPG